MNQSLKLLIKEILNTLQHKVATQPVVIQLKRDLHLVHVSDVLVTKPKLTNGVRLIPKSFSLSTDGTWNTIGQVASRFRLKKGSKLLIINRPVFFSYGEEVATPVDRGKLIAQHARSLGVDAVKLNLGRASGLEYAVLNLKAIELDNPTFYET